MTRPAFQRDNILTGNERAESARKCLALMADISEQSLIRSKDFDFLQSHRQRARFVNYEPTEPQLLWLRDMVDRYVTNAG